ncbi:MAG: hypothetical protein QHH06_08625 [Clostridiales bacterium]|nr:hypothetical protein [Eubacteriales bacterium]MDH7566531.1 hypothetical protein [Clostridiales bacterium]
MTYSRDISNDSSLLFFILVYLLLFYDSSCIGILRTGVPRPVPHEKDSTPLFFILVFLLLFYRN